MTPAKSKWESEWRAKGNNTFTARLSRHALQILREYAELHGCSRSEAIESILLSIRHGHRAGGMISGAIKEHGFSYEEAVKFLAASGTESR
jgi:hypothetical protein